MTKLIGCDVKVPEYRCKHCGGVVKRTDQNGKKWYKSYCEETGKNVHMILVEKPNTKMKTT